MLFPTFVVLLGCASWTTRLPGQGNDWQLAKTVAQLETPFAVGPGVQALGEWQRANATGGSEVQRATVMLALLAAGSTGNRLHAVSDNHVPLGSRAVRTVPPTAVR